MADLQCTVQKIQQPEEPTMTVGERFLLSCSGAIPEMDGKAAELRLDEKEKYTLKLLRFERKSENEVQLEVLSDRVGKHDLKDVQIVDSQQSLVIPQLQFEVRSVQDPQSPVQEPYGSLGPMNLIVPWYYWMGLLMVVSLIGIAITWRILRRVERRRQMQQILNAAPGTSPEGELFQKIRKIQRQADFLLRPNDLVPADDAAVVLNELDQAYRTFLSRVYLIPIALWPTGKALTALNREQDQLSEKNRKFTAKVLREMDRAQQAEHRGRDIAQMIEWVGESAGLVVKEGARV